MDKVESIVEIGIRQSLKRPSDALYAVDPMMVMMMMMIGVYVCAHGRLNGSFFSEN